jgi:hypothetical protein
MVAPMHKSLIACAFALALAASARAADVDWKMYGTASIDGGVVCFYESKGVIAQSASTLRVWTKCLLQKDLDSVDFDDDLGKKIVDSSARKVIKGYMPPIAVVEDMDLDQAIGVIQAEEIANLSNIHPSGRLFYELNCSERMMRRLSTYVRDFNGKEGFSHEPSGWEYVPPEGNGARLLKILCR